MNHSNVRFTVFSVGIVSGLLLLLYLPVLIWSPPWGERGYFGAHLEDCVFTHFDNGVLSFTFLSGGKQKTIRESFIYVNGIWRCDKAKHPNPIFDEIKLINNKMLVFADGLSPNDFGGTKKESNPLTLWHIKWLEWTAESP